MLKGKLWQPPRYPQKIPTFAPAANFRAGGGREGGEKEKEGRKGKGKEEKKNAKVGRNISLIICSTFVNESHRSANKLAKLS
jgi:hypothetical protein